ncbi:MAG: energy-coupled thiamine transporter ThiT [Clostridia bacterium]|nr:energy-coupled thiamine transporter ThiT [Clostridia bacterium]
MSDTANAPKSAKFRSFSSTRRLTESALMIAIAAVIELISKLVGLELPFGGTITIASMFPIILISYRHGVRWGLLTGFVYSLVQIVLGVKTVSAMFLPGDDQMILWQAICVCLLDYVLAYTVLGFGGIFRNVIKKPALGLALGVVVALLLRYLVHIVSGAIFYGAWAEWFFSQEGFYSIGSKILERFSGASLSIVYSIFYNGLYMIPEIVITTVVAAVLGNVPQITGVKTAKKKQPADGNISA